MRRPKVKARPALVSRGEQQNRERCANARRSRIPWVANDEGLIALVKGLEGGGFFGLSRHERFQGIQNLTTILRGKIAGIVWRRRCIEI